MSQRTDKPKNSGTSFWPVIVLTKADMILQPMDYETTVVSMSPLKRSVRVEIR